VAVGDGRLSVLDHGAQENGSIMTWGTRVLFLVCLSLVAWLVLAALR